MCTLVDDDFIIHEQAKRSWRVGKSSNVKVDKPHLNVETVG